MDVVNYTHLSSSTHPPYLPVFQVASVEVFFTCRPSDRLLFTAGTALAVGVGSAERALRVAKGPAGGAEFSPDGQASELNEFGSVPQGWPWYSEILHVIAEIYLYLRFRPKNSQI